jgi:hypothetical protein
MRFKEAEVRLKFGKYVLRYVGYTANLQLFHCAMLKEAFWHFWIVPRMLLIGFPVVIG